MKLLIIVIILMIITITIEFNRQNGPLLSGSCYFRMVKKLLYGNSCFRQSGHITHEIKSSIYVVDSSLTWVTYKVNFRIHSDQWVSNLTDIQILQVCEGAYLSHSPCAKGMWLDEVNFIATPTVNLINLS